jgi:predicted dehydrogenase
MSASGHSRAATPPARVAVVGCGAIAYEHLGHLTHSPLVTLVGVADTSPTAASFATERFGAARAYTDLAAMLAESAPDVVHVLTPPHTHVELVEQCLAAGADVICEKPAAPDAATLDRMIDAAEQAGRRFVESQNMRYNDPVQAIVAATAAGRLGEVREVDLLLSLDFVAGRFGDPNLSGPAVRLPGGAVHDLLPHHAYLFFLLGDVPETAESTATMRVTGRLRNASGNPRVGFDELDALVFAGRVRGRLRIVSDLAPDAFRIVVRGTAAAIETDLYHPYLRTEGGSNVGKRIAVEHAVSGARLAWSGVTDLRDKVRQHGTYHGLGRMLDAFYAARAAGAPTPVTADQMRAAAALTDALIGLAEAS